MFQLIDSPTRGNNCLDLLITSIVEGVYNIDITGCDSVASSSDHCGLTFTIHFSSRMPANNNKGLRFNFKRAHFDGLRSSLRNDSFFSSFSPSEIEDGWFEWKSSFLSHVEEFVPKRKPRKFTTPPWFDGELLHAIRKKNSVRKKALKKDSNFLWDKFRTLRKNVKYMARSSLRSWRDA